MLDGFPRSEDTCGGRYPSPIVTICARGQVQRWAPASAGACGGECKPLSPQSPHPRRRPGSPAARALSQPQEAPACAGDAERGEFVIPESASRLSGAHPARRHPCCWVPDICSRKFRDDRHGTPVGRVMTRQYGAHGPAGYAPLTRPTDCGTREAIATLTLQSNHAFAKKVGGVLKAEQAALPTLIQWCHTNGYGYHGEPQRSETALRFPRTSRVSECAILAWRRSRKFWSRPDL